MSKVFLTCGIFLMLALPSLADGTVPDEYYGHMWNGGHGMGFGFGLFGFVLMALFWAAIIAVVVIALRWVGHPASFGSVTNDALDVLRQRLARGEIDPEEFMLRKRALEE